MDNLATAPNRGGSNVHLNNINGNSEKITTAEDLLALVMQSLDDDQAQEIVQIDLEGKSSIADYMVIAMWWWRAN